MEQVVAIYGAGVILDRGPAPQIGLLRIPAAQVPPLFPHLLQQPFTPAPATAETCATGMARSFALKKGPYCARTVGIERFERKMGHFCARKKDSYVDTTLFLPHMDDLADVHVVDAEAGAFIPFTLLGGHEGGVELLAVELLALDGEVGFGVDGVAEVREFDG